MDICRKKFWCLPQKWEAHLRRQGQRNINININSNSNSDGDSDGDNKNLELHAMTGAT
jgi:hypothetical protein